MEIDILDSARQGDKHSFRLIYNEYKHKVFGTAYLILKDKQHAEDVVQETFLQVYHDIKHLSNLYAFDKWLYRIATSKSIDKLRKRKMIDAYSIEDEDNANGKLVTYEGESLEDQFIKKEFQLCIMKVIKSLSPKHRTVLILYYYNEFDVTEIAEIINCTEGTVKSRLFYARKTLKEKLEEQNLNFPDTYFSKGGVIL